MKILSHRGFWKEPSEKNSLIAFERSFEHGFGTETDVRDYKGELVIAHDMAKDNDILLDDFFQILKGRNLCLALNIKSDGLAKALKKSIEKFNISEYFVFDMSLPDQCQYVREGLNVFSGISDLNLVAPLKNESRGIWLDSFKGDWFGPDFINQLLLDGKQVCLVSPDLHKRSNTWLWNMLKDSNLFERENLYLCTDFPCEAEEFFKRLK